MIVEADQYILLTEDNDPYAVDGCRPVRWTTQGIFSDQTEIVKWMMITTLTFRDFKIVKVKLPLIERPGRDTVDLDELTENAEVQELKDEPIATPKE